jgi:hypothetical protein
MMRAWARRRVWTTSLTSITSMTSSARSRAQKSVLGGRCLPRRVAGRWAGTGCRSLDVSTGADVRPWIGQREVPSLEEIIEEERGFFLRTDSDADQRLSKREFIKHFLDSMGTRNIMGTRAQLTKLLVCERTSGVGRRLVTRPVRLSSGDFTQVNATDDADKDAAFSFTEFDGNGDGFVDWSEWSRMMCQPSQPHPAPSLSLPAYPPSLLLRSRGAQERLLTAHCHRGRFHEQEQDPEYRDGEEVVPSEFPTAEQVKHLAKMFQQADTDGSGSLTKDEVGASLFICQVHEEHEEHEELSHCFLRALQPAFDPALVGASEEWDERHPLRPRSREESDECHPSGHNPCCPHAPPAELLRLRLSGD